MFRGYINNWQIIKGNDGLERVSGIITKHATFPDGSLMRTSPVIRKDIDGSIVETQTGGVYILQNPVSFAAEQAA